MRNRVTAAQIEERITKIEYYQWPGTTVTLCQIKLENGFSVRGESACVDHAMFDSELGQRLAYKNAFEQLWPLEGYLLAEERWRASNLADALDAQ